MRLPPVPDRVMVRQDEGDWYAMNLETGELYSLNQSAADILSCCRRGLTLDEAVDEISSRHVAGLEKVRPDVIKTVARLKELGLVADAADAAASAAAAGKDDAQ